MRSPRRLNLSHLSLFKKIAKENWGERFRKEEQSSNRGILQVLTKSHSFLEVLLTENDAIWQNNNQTISSNSSSITTALNTLKYLQVEAVSEYAIDKNSEGEEGLKVFFSLFCLSISCSHF